MENCCIQGSTANLENRPFYLQIRSHHSNGKYNLADSLTSVFMQKERKVDVIRIDRMMKNVHKWKKRFIFALSLSALLVYMVHSCMDESSERQFEGLIYCHNMKGEFVNGWVYKGGKVVATKEYETFNEFDNYFKHVCTAWSCTENKNFKRF